MNTAPLHSVFVKFDQLNKKYGNKTVLNNLTYSFEKPLTVVLGKSGGGKSTLLRIIAGLENQNSGHILNSSKKLSYIFQDANLLPWLTVYQNITLPFKILNEELPHRDDVLKYLLKVNLEDILDHYPHQLSGGMKMRVSIVRALITKPDLILADEPFSSLDEITRFQIQDLFKDLIKKNNVKTIFVTHSFFEAAYLGNEIIMLTKNGLRVYDKDLSQSDRFSLELQTYIKTLSKEFEEEL